MYVTPEQIQTANKANVETLFGLTNKAFEGVERLVELNLQVAKAALSEAAEGTKAALSVKDAQELLSLQAGLLQPSAEKAVAYGRHVYDIAATTNAEVTKVAEAQMAELQKKFLAGVDGAIKNAPAGDFRIVYWHEASGFRGGVDGRFGEEVTIKGPALEMKPIEFDVTPKK